MKNKLLIAILILITVSSCTKENMRLSNDSKSPKEQLMGKWYLDNPSLWVLQFTPTEMTRNPGGATKKIVGLNDSIIYFEKLYYYPGYIEAPYKINGDTLWLDGVVFYLRFKN